jgi:hypothetical protein
MADGRVVYTLFNDGVLAAGFKTIHGLQLVISMSLGSMLPSPSLRFNGSLLHQNSQQLLFPRAQFRYYYIIELQMGVFPVAVVLQ